MRQKIIFPIFCSILLFSFFSEANQKRHLDELKSKFPYGLLTDDYGILTKSDLAINDCIATPIPFTDQSISYPYWKCFETKDITLKCEIDDIPDEYEGILGLLVVTIIDSQRVNEYIGRRKEPVKECKDRVIDLKKVLKNTQHACISGSFIRNEIHPPKKVEMAWVFEKMKTKKGCEGRDCDFTEKFKRDNCRSPSPHN